MTQRISKLPPTKKLSGLYPLLQLSFSFLLSVSVSTSLVNSALLPFRRVTEGGGAPVLGDTHVAWQEFGAFAGASLYVADIATGSKTLVASTGAAIPQGGGQVFSDFGRMAISGTQLAFIGDGGAKTGTSFNGIYLFNIPSRTLSKVVDITDMAPIRSASDPVTNFAPIVDLDFHAGKLVFSTNFIFSGPAGRGGVYVRDGGGIKSLVDDLTVIPAMEDIGAATQRFNSFGNVSTNGSAAAFTVGASDRGGSNEGIYTKNLGDAASESPDLARDSRNLGEGGGPSFRFFAVSDFKGGLIAFRGSFDVGENLIGGFYTMPPGGESVTEITRQTGSIPDTNGFATWGFHVFINNNFSTDGNQVAFHGFDDPSNFDGIYLGGASVLVQRGDNVDGGIVSRALMTRKGLRNGRIAFLLVFQDTAIPTSIYVSDSSVPPTPIPDPDQNLFIREIIIQQGVPDTAKLLVDRQTLVQVRPGRSYLTGRQRLRIPLEGVTALLHVVSDADVEISGSPFTPTGIPTRGGVVSGSKRTMTLRGDGRDNQYSKRSRRVGDDTLNFILPPLPSDGRFRYWAEINPERTIPENDYDDNRHPSFDGIGKTAVVTTPLRVLVGRFRLLGFTDFPPQESMFRVGDLMQWVYPLEVGDLEVIPTGHRILTRPFAIELFRTFVTALEARFLMEWYNVWSGNNADIVVFVGMDGSFSSDSAHGISYLGTDASLVLNETGRLASTSSHEGAHHFGLGDTYSGGRETSANPRECPQRCLDAGNRLPRGAFNWFNKTFVGYRPFEIHPQSMQDRHEVDFMGNEVDDWTWVDLRTWNHLLNQFELDVPKSRKPPYQTFKGTETQVAVLAGGVRQTQPSQTGLLHTINLLPSAGVEVSNPPDPGPYHLRFRDPSEAVLLDWSFDLSFEITDLQDISELSSVFAFTIPFPNGTQHIDLEFGNEPLVRQSVSANAPTVSLLSPTGGENLQGEVEVSWTANDPDGDDLFFNLTYFDGDQAAVLITGVTESSYPWDTSMHVSTGAGRIQVSVSDGILTDLDTSALFALQGGEFPLPFIQYPTDGDRISENRTLLALATHYDPAGRDVSYSWSLDGGGELATGAQVELTGLPVGNPTLRVTTTAGSDQGTAEVSIDVFADPDGDGIPSDWESDNGLNPNEADAGEDGDMDGLSNFDEWRAGTDPSDPDSDGDGFLDGGEWDVDSDPDNGDETPLTVWNRIVDHDGDGDIDGDDVLAWQKGWQRAGLSETVRDSDLDRNQKVDARDGHILIDIFGEQYTIPLPTPMFTPTGTPTPTLTPIDIGVRKGATVRLER